MKRLLSSILALALLTALVTSVSADSPPLDWDDVFNNDHNDDGHECGYDIIVVNRTQGIIVFSTIGGILAALTVIAVVNSVKTPKSDDESQSKTKGVPPKKKNKKKKRRK
jgi:hypothetical protein